MAKGSSGTKSSSNYAGSTYKGPSTSTRSFGTPGFALDADDIVKRLTSSYMATRMTYTSQVAPYLRMPSAYDTAFYASQRSRNFYSSERKYD